MIRVVVPGAAGKMGQMVLAALAADGKARLTAAVERAGQAQGGTPARPGGPVITDDLATAFVDADVYIDFTVPDAAARAVVLAAERGVAAVIGTTGLGNEARQAIF